MPFTLITGGASSGKSAYALQLFRNRSDVSFIATGVRTDAEMKRRIEEHARERPKSWETLEESVDLIGALGRMNQAHGGVIVDCITMWVSNLHYLKGLDSRLTLERADQTASYLERTAKDVIVVSNELGMGIVPPSEESREFRKTAGEVNQIFARHSEQAYLIVSGMPLKLK
jgi:adenosyl cobinamide kinase/adenosyl cobinamide phosphate guanylyltransferase